MRELGCFLTSVLLNVRGDLTFEAEHDLGWSVIGDDERLWLIDGQHRVEALKRAEERRSVSKVLGDGAYDSGDVFTMLEERGIGAVIKPRRKSRPDTPSPTRRRAVRQYVDLDHQAWARPKGYGRRWMVEIAFSTFKRLFGEHSLARSLENIAHELVAKVALYNMLVNM